MATLADIYFQRVCYIDVDHFTYFLSLAVPPLWYRPPKKLPWLYCPPRAVARQDDARCETQNWHPPPFIKNIYPSASQASREVANLTKRRNPFWQEIITQTCPIWRGVWNLQNKFHLYLISGKLKSDFTIIMRILIKMTPLLKMTPFAVAHTAHT